MKEAIFKIHMDNIVLNSMLAWQRQHSIMPCIKPPCYLVIKYHMNYESNTIGIINNLQHGYCHEYVNLKFTGTF